jgi:hypothetical protein
LPRSMRRTCTIESEIFLADVIADLLLDRP